MEYLSISASNTKLIAQNFVKNLPNNSIISLNGDLGSGKTQFVKGVARAFEISENEIISPTFVFRREYMSSLINIFHFDMYRLDIDNFSKEEKRKCLDDIGLFDTFNQGLVLIEWGEKVKDIVKFNYKIRLEKKGSDLERLITVTKL